VDERLHRVRGGASRQGRGKRRRRTEAGVGARDEARRDRGGASHRGTTGASQRGDPPGGCGGTRRAGKWIPRAGSVEGASNPTGGGPERAVGGHPPTGSEGPAHGRGPRG